MFEEKDNRKLTCGWCGKLLVANGHYYRDYSRVRGYFCNAEHCDLFVENGNQSNVDGLGEDDRESLYEVKQRGFTDYADMDD